MTLEVWCPMKEDFASTAKGGYCSLKLGSADGSLTAPCPYSETSKCPLIRNRRESP